MIFVVGGGTKGSGEDTSAFAYITVNYPSGSTCTATKGTKTLTASGSVGTWVFLVPEAGSWIISCTDGFKSASSTVSITTEGQNEKIALSYRTYLVQDGEVVFDLVPTRGTITSNYNDSGTASWDPGSYVALLKATLDVTTFSKIVLNVTAGLSWHGGQTPGVGCSNENVTINSSSAVVSQYYAYAFLNSSSGSISEATHEVDISEVSDTKTIWISLSYGSASLSRPYVRIRNWYLE